MGKTRIQPKKQASYLSSDGADWQEWESEFSLGAQKLWRDKEAWVRFE